MTIRDASRAVPALLRVGVLEVLAYRGEMLTWALTTTMPLVMLAFFGALASEGPLGRYDEPKLVAYFLATFVVRQLTSSWASWQISQEIRDGTLAAKLLRPLPPLVAYATESVAAIPMRAALALPVGVALLFFVGARELTRDPLLWALAVVSLVGGWLISLLVSFAIGALAFFIESSAKVMDLWLAAFFVFSGYLVPIDLFPPRLAACLDYLPFRYQLGLPVELMTGAHERHHALVLVERQWVFVALAGVVMLTLWRRGQARFAAYGG